MPSLASIDYGISPHFRLKEFFYNPADIWAVGYYLQNKAEFDKRLYGWCTGIGEPIIQRFGVYVDLVSGIRSPTHNKRVGGASQSQHLFARAGDIKVRAREGVLRVPSLQEVQQYARTLPAVGGLALGPIGDDGKPAFLHLDTRPRVLGKIVEWRY